MRPLETYLAALREISATGAALPETSYYGALETLLNEVGKGLRPRVRCVLQTANRGAGIPDGGLFTAAQFQRSADAEPLPDQLPERGVLEVKSPARELTAAAASAQVRRYVEEYGLVLVTNYRGFAVVGGKQDGDVTVLEGYELAPDEAAFWRVVRHPRGALNEHGDRFPEFLKRALLYGTKLTRPRDVAWFLASYARDARLRVQGMELAALDALRSALEEALGVRFEGDRGEHLFRSTLIQTLFYGVFSAWVLWHREGAPQDARFDWRQAAWSLRVPMIQALFEQVARPTRLAPLGLVEPLDRAAAVLARVGRTDFFQRFEEEHAVQYFYEPFLETFDPDLRKNLGVWYTPPEVVRYMVERVDAVLRRELHLADGLADPNVYILDPCCGTGAYLVETLRKIGETLEAKGGDALLAADLKRAAQERVFGFEILPAPFVVAHLQLGLLLHRRGAPLARDGSERAGVFLTNALTGWHPPEEAGKQQLVLNFPELARERDAANEVKQSRPILVILGNPPYNGFAGLAMAEERDLTDAYRATRRAPAPQGQGLNDLYVRFYRMAERKIVEGMGRGVVCFISNYSWLDGLSFPGMRERYLDVFDRIWIDNLNGDKYKTGKLTPEGEPDPSIFSTRWNREGIQVGTAISLLVRQSGSRGTGRLLFRNLWGKRKREELLGSLGQDDARIYESLEPPAELGFPFLPAAVTSAYLTWPRLPEVFPASFPGVKTSRDELLVDIDRDRLEARMLQYFDPAVSHEEMARICPTAMRDRKRFSARRIRETLQRRGFLPDHIVRYAYRPFDVRWLYWEPETKLLDEKRSEYFPHVRSDNPWLEVRQKLAKEGFDRGYVTTLLADNFGNGLSSFFPPFLLRHTGDRLFEPGATVGEPNLSPLSLALVAQLDVEPIALFHHVVSVLHAPAYRKENASALRQDWPRIPLPATRESLVASAELGRQVAALLHTEQEVPGVTHGTIRQDLRPLAVFSLAGGSTLNEAQDLVVTAGWGHEGRGGITMPGRGKAHQRGYAPDEAQAFAAAAHDGLELLGRRTWDIYLNGNAFWRNVPDQVWAYTLGGYQVLKKWLSYRDLSQLGRRLKLDEARYFSAISRRIAALLLLGPELDRNYQTIRSDP